MQQRQRIDVGLAASGAPVQAGRGAPDVLAGDHPDPGTRGDPLADDNDGVKRFVLSADAVGVSDYHHAPPRHRTGEHHDARAGRNHDRTVSGGQVDPEFAGAVAVRRRVEPVQHHQRLDRSLVAPGGGGDGRLTGDGARATRHGPRAQATQDAQGDQRDPKGPAQRFRRRVHASIVAPNRGRTVKGRRAVDNDSTCAQLSGHRRDRCRPVCVDADVGGAPGELQAGNGERSDRVGMQRPDVGDPGG
jgi:hypothetical protein